MITGETGGAQGNVRFDRSFPTAKHNLLQEQVARISNPAMRRTYLENVPAHRTLAEEAAKRG